MKEVRLAYGREGLVARVPDDAVVVTATELARLGDEAGAVLEALERPVVGPPLGELMAMAARKAARNGRSGPSVAVVFPDLTRPMPNRTVLPPLLGELDRLGAGPDKVKLLCATGTHRLGTDDEMVELLGPEIVGRYKVHQHRADAPGDGDGDGGGDDHVEVGRVDGTPIRIDRHYVEADVRILTGFVEPHFFAGFSGGPKGACPGLAGLETILEAHSPRRISDPRATWLVTEGNPVHDFVRAAVGLAPPTLSVDVAINSRRQLTGVFVGPLPDGHRAACRFVEATSVQSVGARFDVVLSTNGGYPLDRNLYQAVKGMAAAERVVRAGGTIVMAAACVDGTPDGSSFARLLAEASGPGGLDGLDDVERPSETDRWQAQVLGRVLRHGEVWFHTDGLTDEAVAAAFLRPVRDVTDAVAEALDGSGSGRRTRLGVLPYGPLTVASAT
ncbi:MAG TPA: nickel-dependent lactate racemase [Acidimicrobiales bacterium]|nr:nickel-dependent lactate racemase [Acidimicrobiales bacterium]